MRDKDHERYQGYSELPRKVYWQDVIVWLAVTALALAGLFIIGGS